MFFQKKELKNCQTYFSSIDAHCLQLHTISSFLTFHAHGSDNWSPTIFFTTGNRFVKTGSLSVIEVA